MERRVYRIDVIGEVLSLKDISAFIECYVSGQSYPVLGELWPRLFRKSYWVASKELRVIACFKRNFETFLLLQMNLYTEQTLRKSKNTLLMLKNAKNYSIVSV